jgi:hypothetical protein
VESAESLATEGESEGLVREVVSEERREGGGLWQEGI